MMFRQIKVNEEDCYLQIIVWRDSETALLLMYLLNTVTYGTGPAPFLAMESIEELSIEESSEFPLAALVLIVDGYMDDIITESDDLKTVIDLQKQLTTLLARDQFPLRKWRSNDERILQQLSHESKADDLLILNKEEPMKTLRILWDQKTDTFQYSVKSMNNTKITKRVILSEISQIYDLLGKLEPIIIKAKIIMQQLWSLNIGWDESLPQDLYSKWKAYRLSLTQLNELRIPRCIKNNSSRKITIFEFGDASEKAYGACLYAVTQSENGEFCSNLLCAKFRVAPLKALTIARLELCAARLIAKLSQTARQALGD
ncbi:uncharacterized protein [Temnothorax longispinosus]|uniref:uncharacterized protein n=1 Tax=Temnothorax longispinosus TaxID=300112 RepID=UPI003A996ADA